AAGEHGGADARVLPELLEGGLDTSDHLRNDEVERRPVQGHPGAPASLLDAHEREVSHRRSVSAHFTLASPGSSPAAPRPRLGSVYPDHFTLASPGSSPAAPRPRLGSVYPNHFKLASPGSSPAAPRPRLCSHFNSASWRGRRPAPTGGGPPAGSPP